MIAHGPFPFPPAQDRPGAGPDLRGGIPLRAPADAGRGIPDRPGTAGAGYDVLQPAGRHADGIPVLGDHAVLQYGGERQRTEGAAGNCVGKAGRKHRGAAAAVHVGTDHPGRDLHLPGAGHVPVPGERAGNQHGRPEPGHRRAYPAEHPAPVR